MQTFLPFPDFKKSLSVLDYKRLGKQRVEAKQILNALNGLSKGWVNHPTTKMWRGYSDALSVYMNLSIQEWVSRGYKNTMDVTHHGFDVSKVPLPPWFGNSDFHISHQSNLLRKLPDWYTKFFNVPNDLPYIWPE